jgi:uncharacterized protein YjiS (DUF1127 family)
MSGLPSSKPLPPVLSGFASGSALPRVTRLTATLVQAVRAWDGRRRGRRSLAHLDAHLLRDIGLSMQDATEEISKPFWRD